jgi:TonB family protein
MKILTTAIAAGYLWLCGQPQTLSLDKRAVALMQQLPVSSLDPQLPNRPFANWFREIVGHRAGVVWQLSECGGRAGNPADRGTELTACAEANAMLPDGRKVVVMVAVGTFQNGITGKPALHHAVIEQRGVFYPVKRLRDLPKKLRTPKALANKSPVVLPEITEVKQLVLHPHVPRVPPGIESGKMPGSSSVSDDAPSPPPPKPGPDPKGNREFQELSEGVLLGNAITKVGPVYPANAKRANASGEVQVRVMISEEGRVIEAKAISGHPLLRNAAVIAARQWIFRPTKLHGVPVPVEGILTFVFPNP